MSYFAPPTVCGHHSFQWHSTGDKAEQHRTGEKKYNHETMDSEGKMHRHHGIEPFERGSALWIECEKVMFPIHFAISLVEGTDIQQCFVYNSLVRVLGGQTMDCGNRVESLSKQSGSTIVVVAGWSSWSHNNSTEPIVATRYRFTHIHGQYIYRITDHRSCHSVTWKSINQWAFTLNQHWKGRQSINHFTFFSLNTNFHHITSHSTFTFRSQSHSNHTTHCQICTRYTVNVQNDQWSSSSDIPSHRKVRAIKWVQQMISNTIGLLLEILISISISISIGSTVQVKL